MLKHFNSKIIISGTDEAGRGCLAGPVTAAAVILPKNFRNKILNDSKVLSLKKRNLLRSYIEDNAVAYGIAHIYMEEIDKINILNASILAMHRALDNMNHPADQIIVDGNRFKNYKQIPHECIIKGDGKFLSIAAASILAKTGRDEYMQQIHEEYPMYNWQKNKGYPTKEHRAAIEKYGITKYHRKSFKLLPDQLKIEF
ncbi:ribonuclease HII [Christiangramia sabulilitoris]|uniref:Ribonuclease HII n=1 Tax=Christiangramia sabulilitoris TaxID=2583991 RepID=A0A550I7T7_9FLAO|nr:ribonuclease HII [Christiangramia sabulilitoris]TRO67043.1 ribonuclease HII [Christiangramia sabulilitoris]